MMPKTPEQLQIDELQPNQNHLRRINDFELLSSWLIQESRQPQSFSYLQEAGVDRLDAADRHMRRSFGNYVLYTYNPDGVLKRNVQLSQQLPPRQLLLRGLLMPAFIAVSPGKITPKKTSKALGVFAEKMVDLLGDQDFRLPTFDSESLGKEMIFDTVIGSLTLDGDRTTIAGNVLKNVLSLTLKDIATNGKWVPLVEPGVEVITPWHSDIERGDTPTEWML